MAAEAVTDESFEKSVLASVKPVLVDFWAEWCGPCRALGPIVDELAVERADTLSVVKVDVDENSATAEKYGITSIPVLKLFQNGQVVKTWRGAASKQALETDLAELIG